jgi:hypothetical protein
VFGITWAEIYDMPRAELDAFLDRLHALAKQPTTPRRR